MLDETTKSCVAAEQEGNVHAHIGISEDEFVKMRTEQDANLCVPKLIIPSIQVNVFLKVPFNKL